jgi:hypothetical protein
MGRHLVRQRACRRQRRGTHPLAAPLIIRSVGAWLLRCWARQHGRARQRCRSVGFAAWAQGVAAPARGPTGMPRGARVGLVSGVAVRRRSVRDTSDEICDRLTGLTPCALILGACFHLAGSTMLWWLGNTAGNVQSIQYWEGLNSCSACCDAGEMLACCR